MMWQELQNSDRDVYQPAAPTMTSSNSRNAPSSAAARSRNHRSLRHAGGAHRRSSAQNRCQHNMPGFFHGAFFIPPAVSLTRRDWRR